MTAVTIRFGTACLSALSRFTSLYPLFEHDVPSGTLMPAHNSHARSLAGRRRRRSISIAIASSRSSPSAAGLPVTILAFWWHYRTERVVPSPAVTVATELWATRAPPAVAVANVERRAALRMR